MQTKKLKFYYTGEPCVRGHVTGRVEGTGECVGCMMNDKVPVMKRHSARKVYCTGEPCKYGHYSVRYARSNACLACARGKVTPSTANREEAHCAGLVDYESTRPCPDCGRTRRYVSIPECTSCVPHELLKVLFDGK